MRFRIIQLFFVLFFALFLCGCEANGIGSKLKWLDDEIGKGLDRIQKSQPEDLASLFNKSDIDKNKIRDNIKFSDLTKDEKEKIDAWLEKNNLNRYGDPEDTIYIGGTPLFNEETGKNIDRFDYIFKKHPNLINKIQ